MTSDECIKLFGLPASKDALDEVRAILNEHVKLESQRQGAGDTELMKLCAFSLFCEGSLDDVMLIWQGKCASMDANASLDIQFLCGAGLMETKSFLERSSAPNARAALTRISECERQSDFEGFCRDTFIQDYLEYFSLD